MCFNGSFIWQRAVFNTGLKVALIVWQPGSHLWFGMGQKVHGKKAITCMQFKGDLGKLLSLTESYIYWDTHTHTLPVSKEVSLYTVTHLHGNASKNWRPHQEWQHPFKRKTNKKYNNSMEKHTILFQNGSVFWVFTKETLTEINLAHRLSYHLHETEGAVQEVALGRSPQQDWMSNHGDPQHLPVAYHRNNINPLPPLQDTTKDMVSHMSYVSTGTRLE